MVSPGRPAALLFLLALAPGAWGQVPPTPQPPPPPPAAPDSTVQAAAPPDTVAGVPVVVGADTVFRIYARLGPLSVEQRAAAIGERARRASRGLRAGRDSLIATDADGQTLIQVGETVIMAVLDEDARAAGLDRATLAARYLDSLHAAFGRGTVRWRVQRVAIGVLLTLATTLALAGLVWVLRRAWARGEALLDRLRRSRRLPSVKLQRLELISADRIADTARFVARGAQVLVWAVLLYFYLVLVLSFFPWTRGASDRILEYALRPVGVIGTGIVAYLPNIFFIAVIVLVTRYVLRFIRFLFDAVESGAVTLSGFEPEWATPTYKLVRVLVLAFSLVVLFPYLPGSESPAFRGVSIFVGVLFSLGSTGAVANLVAGTLLTYTRSFRIGDRVRIGDTVGDVTARTLLVTKVRTVTNVEVTLPNSTVMSSAVLNYSAMAGDEGLIIQTTVTIGYDAPWRRVHDLLLAAARTTPDVLATPEPFVVQTGLSDYYPAYELNAFINDAAGMRRIRSALHERIQDVFFEAGVEITSPAYTAIRDGNAAALPPGHLPSEYEPPSFRVVHTGGGGRGGAGGGGGDGGGGGPGGSGGGGPGPRPPGSAPDPDLFGSV